MSPNDRTAKVMLELLNMGLPVSAQAGSDHWAIIEAAILAAENAMAERAAQVVRDTCYIETEHALVLSPEGQEAVRQILNLKSPSTDQRSRQQKTRRRANAGRSVHSWGG